MKIRMPITVTRLPTTCQRQNGIGTVKSRTKIWVEPERQKYCKSRVFLKFGKPAWLFQQSSNQAPVAITHFKINGGVIWPVPNIPDTYSSTETGAFFKLCLDQTHPTCKFLYNNPPGKICSTCSRNFHNLLSGRTMNRPRKSGLIRNRRFSSLEGSP